MEIATAFVGTHADVEGIGVRSAWGKIRKMEVPVSSCIKLLILHLDILHLHLHLHLHSLYFRTMPVALPSGNAFTDTTVVWNNLVWSHCEACWCCLRKGGKMIVREKSEAGKAIIRERGLCQCSLVSWVFAGWSLHRWTELFYKCNTCDCLSQSNLAMLGAIYRPALHHIHPDCMFVDFSITIKYL